MFGIDDIIKWIAEQVGGGSPSEMGFFKWVAIFVGVSALVKGYIWIVDKAEQKEKNMKKWERGLLYGMAVVMMSGILIGAKGRKKSIEATTVTADLITAKMVAVVDENNNPVVNISSSTVTQGEQKISSGEIMIFSSGKKVPAAYLGGSKLVLYGPKGSAVASWRVDEKGALRVTGFGSQ